MGSGIKLISLNIELDRHLDRVINFVKSENPDVLCLMEVLKDDFGSLKETFNMDGVHAPLATIQMPRFKVARGKEFGLAMMSKFGANYKVNIYAGNPDILPECEMGFEDNRAFIISEFDCGGEKFTIGTTHFTWTPNGAADGRQRNDLKKLFNLLRDYPEIVFCGDFNAPRGREIWGEIARRYKDNIPKDCDSTLDPVFHKAPALKYVVDGIFSTPSYAISDVKVIGGVSDHKALVGTIKKIRN